MSHVHSAKRPHPEPSPPSSPSTSHPAVIAHQIQPITTRLPASPPTSSSPSPAHVAGPLSPHVPGSVGTETAMSTTQLESTGSTLKPNESILPRSSSKHRMEDDELEGESHKRRRTDHDHTVAEKPFDLTSEKPSTTDTVEPLFRISEQPLPQSRPHPTSNLMAMYGLDAVATSVRRKDPGTGEKINKLRKSYENHIKEFAGKNKPVSKEGDLFDLLNYPDEEWAAQQAHGKEPVRSLSADQSGLSEDTRQLLNAALAGVTTGLLPQKAKDSWKPIIHPELLATKDKQAEAPSPLRPQPTTAPQQPYFEEPPRPRRRGTKRNYNDDAFEGYNEGYADDGDDGSIDGDDDRRSSISTGARKKARRDPNAPMRSSIPWSPSTVSVGHGR